MKNRYYLMCIIIKNMFPEDKEWNEKWPIGKIMHIGKGPYKIFNNALKEATIFNEKNSSCKAYITNEKGDKVWMSNEVQELFKHLVKL